MIRLAAIMWVLMPSVAHADSIEVAAVPNWRGWVSYAAIRSFGLQGDNQTSIVYDYRTGRLSIDAPSRAQLTAININSASGIFTGAPALNLGGAFDNDTDHNIFKTTFGGSFGSIGFGPVAQTDLSSRLLQEDLTVAGSLAGGGDLGGVDLIYVWPPEPSTMVLALAGSFCLITAPRFTNSLHYGRAGR